MPDLRYAICEQRPDGTTVRVGPTALTASAARAAYRDQLRREAGGFPALSTAARDALGAARQRFKAERQRRWQFDTCGDPACRDCR